MLLKNFKVGHQILSNVAKNSFSAVRFAKKTSLRDGKWFGKWPKYNIRLTAEQYKRRLEQCPKLSHGQICGKKLISETGSKCEMITGSDEYIKARHFVKTRITDMIKIVESESRSIASDLESRSNSDKASHATQLKELFEKTTRKLDKLMSLDVSYGCWMRKETLLLNDEMRRSYEALERAFALNVKRVGSMLKELRCDVSSFGGRADGSIVACREREAPTEFAECVKIRLEEATRALERANEGMRLKLTEIAKFRADALSTHEKTIAEVTEANRKRATEMSDYLERCLVHLKKQAAGRNARSSKMRIDAKSVETRRK